jgi:hypothetical protein
VRHESGANEITGLAGSLESRTPTGAESMLTSTQPVAPLRVLFFHGMIAPYPF